MGLAGLTAVFGMGTGVTPPVWSPEKCPAGGQARPGTMVRTIRWVGHTRGWQSHASDRSRPYRITVRSSRPPRVRGCSEPIGVVKLLGC